MSLSKEKGTRRARSPTLGYQPEVSKDIHHKWVHEANPAVLKMNIALIVDFTECVETPLFRQRPLSCFFTKFYPNDICGVYAWNKRQCHLLDVYPAGCGKCKNYNGVLTSLLRALKKLGVTALTKLVLCMDNCAGQNKCQQVLAVLLCWVRTGLLAEVELYYHTVGHTGNELDGVFGCVKSVLRKMNGVNTPEQLAEALNDGRIDASIVTPMNYKAIVKSRGYPKIFTQHDSRSRSREYARRSTPRVSGRHGSAWNPLTAKQQTSVSSRSCRARKMRFSQKHNWQVWARRWSTSLRKMQCNYGNAGGGGLTALIYESGGLHQF